MKVETDGYSFDFPDALDAFVFDEEDPRKEAYHGAPMKAVDVVAEFKDLYVYVEIKDYTDPSEFDERSAEEDDEAKAEKHKMFHWLKNYLKYKYRDSYLYRYAERKVDKPVMYICLLNFDNALNSRMKKDLSRELPVGKGPKRWKREIVSECHVVNLKKWNENKKLSKWPVKKI